MTKKATKPAKRRVPRALLRAQLFEKYMFANTFSSKHSTARAVTLHTHHFGCALIQLYSVKDELEKHLEHPEFVDSVPGRPELAQLPARCRDSAACPRSVAVLRVASVCARTEGKQTALRLVFRHSSLLHGIQMAHLVGSARQGRCGPAAARIRSRRGKIILRKSPPARASAAHRRRTSAPLPLWFVARFAGEGVLLADRRTVRVHHPAMQEASSSRAVVMAVWLRSAPKKSESRRPVIRSMIDKIRSGARRPVLGLPATPRRVPLSKRFRSKGLRLEQ